MPHLPGTVDMLLRHPQARVALVGRSNVGKSTLINALSGEKMARTSKTPGKTKEPQAFLWEKADLILVDLPGYGYAKVARSLREDWGKSLYDYLQRDDRLKMALMVIDARRSPTNVDLDAYRTLTSLGKDVRFIASKVDQLKRQSERAARRKEFIAEWVEAGIPRQVLNESVWWISSQT
jgi:GTP-binding protein